MTTEKILSTLTIDRTSPKSLKSQLEDQLEVLITRLEPETMLPPERLISETLEISRVTVRNALEKFYRSGEIVRHGRLGTMVAPRKQELPRQINPFILGMEHEMMHHYPLRFMVYEDLPKQKEFWEKLVSEYNASHEFSPVEIVWLPHNLTPKQILDFIKKESIDLMMMSDFFQLDHQKNLAKLPANIKKLQSSDNYIFKNLKIDSDYQIPFYISVPIILWNKDMAEKLEIRDIPERINNGDFLQILQETAKKLDDDCCSGVRIWDYFHFTALPEFMNESGNVLPILKSIIQAGKCGDGTREKLFVLSQQYTLDNLESFLQEKRLFLVANISHLQFFDPPKFRHGYAVFPQKDKLLTDSLQFAITKNCLDFQSATDFLQYLLSEDVQELCADFKENFPVYKPKLQEHLQQRYNFSENDVQDFFLKIFMRKSQNNKDNVFSELLGGCLRNELKELFYGNITAEDFLEIVEARKEQLRNRIQKHL